MTYRLDASITQSQGNVYDVLTSLPGVVIQNDGTIFLNGQNGANILMDGKPTYLSGQDLVNLLKSTPASITDKIDLITHPRHVTTLAETPVLSIYVRRRYCEEE